MNSCFGCQSRMSPSRLQCKACGISVEGRFGVPRLARLDPQDQQLVELFVLAGGNLKLLAEDLSLSYPTLRKRIDSLIARLREVRVDDDEMNERLLKDVESGRMRPEEAARLMTESAHG